MAFRVGESLSFPQATHFQPVANSYNAQSNPASQNSSFNDSMASQQSDSQGHRRPVSQQYKVHLRAVTPATSFSNPSSQEQPKNAEPRGSASHSPRRPGYTSMASQASHPATPAPYSSTSNRMDQTSAPKRMANGHIKTASSSLATSPVDQPAVTRSRTSSTASREGVAADIKARLAFAKFKLDHGFQDLKFSEIEQITSQQGSPISATSDHKTAASPSINMLPPPSTPGQSAAPRISPPQSLYPNALSPQRRSPQSAPNGPPSSIAKSYEDFWSTQAQSQRPPVLAPPLDLQPRSPQHPPHNPNHARPLPPAILHPQAATPSTPQRRPRVGLRSPSEQAQSEAEAAEALTFMSSPNNSGFYPSTGPGAATAPVNGNLLSPPAPMRRSRQRQGQRAGQGTATAMTTQLKRPPPRDANINKRGKGTAGEAQQQQPRPGQDMWEARKGMTDEEINRRLDEMSDTSDEDDDGDGGGLNGRGPWRRGR